MGFEFWGFLGFWVLVIGHSPLIIPPVHFQKITLIGVGLLGGSIGLAAKQRGVAARVCGLVRREESIAECLAAGVVDEATLDVANAVADAGLIILCTPVGQMSELAAAIKPHLAADTIVTDVGSVKASVVTAVEPVLPRFVGSHPLCGSEKAGVIHARGDLLEGAVCAVTPTEVSDAAMVETLSNFWTALGSRVVNLSAANHDAIVARTSHLPHVLASALVNAVLAAPRAGESDFFGTGFRDTTRLASGSPEMWRDITRDNSDAIIAALEGLQSEIDRLKTALSEKDAAALEEFFTEGQIARDSWLADGENK
ncbi:MAG: prephenate dehydrogenase [Verrucomicrobia subdivision 3 bacterium]|nr:prephenate dehydrogenase [Limisphaerales bacterium]